MDNRYYISEVIGDAAVIEGSELGHLSRVRRCKVGDIIMGFNGDGYDYEISLNEISKSKAVGSILKRKENRCTKDKNITVYLSMIKNEALKTAIENLTALNVKEVKLFRSDYTEAVFDESKLDKLKMVVIQSSKQCERADLMKISIINKYDIEKDIIRYQKRFFAYEDSNRGIKSFSGDFAVVIGPEGGFSAEENKYFSSFAENISLGKTILRAELACTTAVSMLRAFSVD